MTVCFMILVVGSLLLGVCVVHDLYFSTFTVYRCEAAEMIRRSFCIV